MIQQLLLKSPHELHLVEGSLIKKIQVVVGKGGIRQDKREGDGATPAGIFPIGPVFGQGEKPNLLMEYLQIFPDTVAVDDPQSKYYNQIVRKSLVTPCWQSCEEMAAIPEYEWGAVIQYNWINPIPGKGSAIFLHLWKDSTTPTAGCVAMAKEDLLYVIKWLDPKKEPVLVYSPF